MYKYYYLEKRHLLFQKPKTLGQKNTECRSPRRSSIESTLSTYIRYLYKNDKRADEAEITNYIILLSYK